MKITKMKYQINQQIYKKILKKESNFTVKNSTKNKKKPKLY